MIWKSHGEEKPTSPSRSSAPSLIEEPRLTADTETKETWRERLPVVPATLEGAQPSSTSATNGFSGARVSTVTP